MYYYLISIKNQNIGRSAAEVANFKVILLAVVQLLIKTSSGLVLVRSSGVAQALMYRLDPVSAIRRFCVLISI